jgi:G:T-mismatch repair DNA endonuclease (very short patch repair protein)
LIPGDLQVPIFSVGLRYRVELAALVAVPETPVDKDDSAIFREYDVWFAGQLLVIHSIPETQVPQGATQLQLRLCRSGVNGDHIAMALIWSKIIRHCNDIVLFANLLIILL